MKLAEYVMTHTVRGECQCGRCCDKGDSPEPAGHTADLIFFKVAVMGDPDAATLRGLVEQHEDARGLLDGGEHSYIEIGAWIGDLGLALRLMGLGSLLGLWKLLTPRTVLGADTPDDLVMVLAGKGYLTVAGKGYLTIKAEKGEG